MTEIRRDVFFRSYPTSWRIVFISLYVTAFAAMCVFLVITFRILSGELGGSMVGVSLLAVACISAISVIRQSLDVERLPRPTAITYVFATSLCTVLIVSVMVGLMSDHTQGQMLKLRGELNEQKREWNEDKIGWNEEKLKWLKQEQERIRSEALAKVRQQLAISRVCYENGDRRPGTEGVCKALPDAYSGIICPVGADPVSSCEKALLDMEASLEGMIDASQKETGASVR